MEEKEVKEVIRCILVSNPKPMTVRDLGKDFRKNEGIDIPFSKYGFVSLLEFLKASRDTVMLDSYSSHNPIVTPVVTKSISHIDSLVMKQKIPTSKRSYGPTATRRKRGVEGGGSAHAPTRKASPLLPTPPSTKSLLGEPPISFHPPPLMGRPIARKPLLDTPSFNPTDNSRKMDHKKTEKPINCNNNSGKISPKFEKSQFLSVPWDVVNLISHMCAQPQGCSFAEIERKLHRELVKAGIKYIVDVVDDLCNYFDVHEGRVYKKSTSNNNYSKNSSRNDGFSSSKPTATEVAAAAVAVHNPSANEKPQLPRWAPVSEQNYIPGGAECSMLNYRSLSDLSDCGSNASDSFRRNTPVNGKSKTYEIVDYDDEDDGVESMISSKMKANLKHLIAKYPEGVYCSQLAALYKHEFYSTLNYDEYGYDCVINMVSDLKSIFTLKRENRNSDWKLFPASLLQNETYVEDKTKKWVAREIIENVCTVLEKNTRGLPLNMLCEKYYDYYKKPLNVENMGFDSVESLIDNMSDHIHKRKVRDKILLYVKADRIRPDHCSDLKPPFSDRNVCENEEDDDPLPDSDKLQSILASLYPDEVCGSDVVYRKQDLPSVTESPTFFEVRVSEVINPYKFWIQLGTEHSKLDNMMLDLDDFYSSENHLYEMPDMTVKPGQVCACTYDGKWHRTVVLNTCGALDVKVEYVDYGTTCPVSKARLRFLHKDFSDLPAQAIMGKLAYIIPPKRLEKWPRESCSQLLNMVADKRLFMSASSFNYEDHRIEGLLIDTSGVEDLVINDFLACHGYAEFSSISNSSSNNSLNEGEDLVNESNALLNHLSEEERTLLTPSPCNSLDTNRISNSLDASVSNSSAKRVVENLINNAYPEISSSIPDLPYGKKEPVTNMVTSFPTIQPTYSMAGGAGSISTGCRPPPGFRPLNNNSATSIGGQDSLFPGNTSGISGPSSVPAEPKSNVTTELLVNMLAAKAFTSPATNYLQNMYNQQPSVKPNQYSSFQDMNAPLWNPLNPPAVNKNPLLYNMPPAQMPHPSFQHNQPPMFNQLNRPAQPTFPQPPLPNVSLPYGYNNANNMSYPRYPPNVPFSSAPPCSMPYNQQYHNYTYPSPYVATQLQGQPLYPWPPFNNIPALPSSLPPPGLSNPSQQVSSVENKQGDGNQLPPSLNFPVKQTDVVTTKTPQSTNSETNLTQTLSENSVISPRSSSTNFNASDDEKQNTLSNKQKKKLDKRESSVSMLNSTASIDSSNKSGGSENKIVASHKNDNGASDNQEIKSSMSVNHSYVNNKELPQNSKTSKKKNRKSKSDSDEDQVNEESAIMRVSSSLAQKTDSNIDSSIISSDKNKVTVVSPSSRSGLHCSLSSVTPVALRRPKSLPTSNVHMLLDKTNSIENNDSSQASKSNNEETKVSIASQTSTESYSSEKLLELALLSSPNNNLDECVVDSWEELADESNTMKDNISKSNVNKDNINNEKTIINNSDNKRTDTNSNNKNGTKSKKQKDKQQKNTGLSKVPSFTTSVNNNNNKPSNNKSTVAPKISDSSNSDIFVFGASQKSNAVEKPTNIDIKEKERKPSTVSINEWIWGSSDDNNSNNVIDSKDRISLEINKQDVKVLNPLQVSGNDSDNNPSTSALSNEQINAPEPSSADCSGNSNIITSCTSVDWRTLTSDHPVANIIASKTETAVNSRKNSIQQNLVIKKVICDKTVHILVESFEDKKLVIATDEFVKLFTKFSKRNSVLRLLGIKQIEVPFYDLHEKNVLHLFQELRSHTIEAVKNEGEQMPDKLNVLPLVAVPNILKALKIDQVIIDGFNVTIDEMNQL